MHYSEVDVPIGLRPFVRAIWHLHGTTIDGPAEPIVPDGCMEIILNFGDRVLQHGVDAQPTVQPTQMVVGQLRDPIVIAPTQRVDIWGIRLQPWAGGSFIGIPARELTGHSIAIADLGCSTFADDLAATCSARDDRERSALIAAALTRRARSVGELSPNVIVLARRAMTANMEPTVGALAARLGLSARRVQVVFAEMVGLSPKVLMRIGRFQRALAFARTNPRRSLSSVAAECGYYDHAHLVRDSQQFAGRSPSAVIGDSTTITEFFLAGE